MNIDNKNILIAILITILSLTIISFNTARAQSGSVDISNSNTTDQQKLIENNSRIQNLQDQIDSGDLSEEELDETRSELGDLERENAALKKKLGGTEQSKTTTKYEGFVKCDGVIDPNSGQVKCDFNSLIYTIKSILKWMFGIGVSISIFLFAWAGLLYMTGSPKNISKAKSILPTVAKGFIIMLVAWLVVYYILDQIVSKEFLDVSKTLLKGDF